MFDSQVFSTKYVSSENKEMLNANNINEAILKLNCNINTNKIYFKY